MGRAWIRALPTASAVAARPLHLALFALVVGLLCGSRVPAAAAVLAATLLAAAALLVVAARRHGDGAGGERDAELQDPEGANAIQAAVLRRAAPLAVAAAVAVILGAAIGDLRTEALARSRLGPDLGRSTSARVVVQEAPRRSRYGGWSALVGLRGEPVLLRISGESEGPLPVVGTILEVDGGLRPPGDFATLRRAHAELRAAEARVAGRRGGVAGVLDGIRTRAEVALDRGLPPVSAGLLRGMVLGQDDALPDETRDAFRAAGLSHLVRSAA